MGKWGKIRFNCPRNTIILTLLYASTFFFF